MSRKDVKVLVAVLLSAGLSACANHLPPHVWIPVEGVYRVDLFWWPEQTQCDLRVIYTIGNDDYRGFTLSAIDPALCGYPKPKPEVSHE